MEPYSLFSLTLILFLLMDSIGSMPMFLAILKPFSTRKQLFIILREMVVALLLIYAFYFVGNEFLSALNISTETISISGGVILFIISLKMIFGNYNKDVATESSTKIIPLIVPLAVPLIAGPATFATVMVYAKQGYNTYTVILAILVSWLASTFILLLSPFLKKLLRTSGVNALEKLMGLILTLISIEMFSDGLRAAICKG